MKHLSYVFFGSSPFSKIVLEELHRAGLPPTLIIDDASTKVSAEMLKEKAPKGGWDVFVVASFGQIITPEVLTLPKHGAVNVHPSLLPNYRGPSPLQSAILTDEQENGVSIMLMDSQVDHGPLIVQEKITIPNWPPTYDELEHTLGKAGGALLAKILPDFVAGKLRPKEQNHAAATFTKKVQKTDGALVFDMTSKNFTGDPYQNFLKIQAYSRWPKAHFFIQRKNRKQRVLITKATFDTKKNALIIEHVIPEGKQEMNWADFAKGYL